MTRADRAPVAILLDSLGTLVALQPPAPVLVRELRERLGIAVTERQAQQAIAAEIAYYRVHLDEGRDQRALAALRGRCTEVLRAALPASKEVAAADVRLLQQALLASLRFEAFPDAKPALELARARGQRLVVVSNWDVSLHDVLHRVALAPLLDSILTSAEAGARKPSPVMFQQALVRAGVSAGQAVHVGDSFEEDVEGAREARIEPVLICRDRRGAPRGVRVIESLLEL